MSKRSLGSEFKAVDSSLKSNRGRRSLGHQFEEVLSVSRKETSSLNQQESLLKTPLKMSSSLSSSSSTSSSKGSPRLKAFDGTDWITAPRTGYTYVESPTYRDTWTPDREIPMPHMARLPLRVQGSGVRRSLLNLGEISEEEDVEVVWKTVANYSSQSLRHHSSLVGACAAYLYQVLKRILRFLLYEIPCYLTVLDTFLLVRSEDSGGGRSDSERSSWISSIFSSLIGVLSKTSSSILSGGFFIVSSFISAFKSLSSIGVFSSSAVHYVSNSFARTFLFLKESIHSAVIMLSSFFMGAVTKASEHFKSFISSGSQSFLTYSSSFSERLSNNIGTCCLVVSSLFSSFFSTSFQSASYVCGTITSHFSYLLSKTFSNVLAFCSGAFQSASTSLSSIISSSSLSSSSSSILSGPKINSALVEAEDKNGHIPKSDVNNEALIEKSTIALTKKTASAAPRHEVQEDLITKTYIHPLTTSSDDGRDESFGIYESTVFVYIKTVITRFSNVLFRRRKPALRRSGRLRAQLEARLQEENAEFLPFWQQDPADLCLFFLVCFLILLIPLLLLLLGNAVFGLEIPLSSVPKYFGGVGTKVLAVTRNTVDSAYQGAAYAYNQISNSDSLISLLHLPVGFLQSGWNLAWTGAQHGYQVFASSLHSAALYGQGGVIYLMSVLGSFFGNAFEWISNLMVAIFGSFAQIYESGLGGINQLLIQLGNALNSTVEYCFNVLKFIIFAVLGGIGDLFSILLGGFFSIVSYLGDAFWHIYISGFDGLSFALASLGDGIRLAFDRSYENTAIGFSSLGNGLSSALEGSLGGISHGLQGIQNGLSCGLASIGGGIHFTLTSLMNGISDFFFAGFENGSRLITSLGTWVGGAIFTVYEGIANLGSAGFDSIASTMSFLGLQVGNLFNSGFGGIWSLASCLGQSFRDFSFFLYGSAFSYLASSWNYIYGGIDYSLSGIQAFPGYFTTKSVASISTLVSNLNIGLGSLFGWMALLIPFFPAQSSTDKVEELPILGEEASMDNNLPVLDIDAIINRVLNSGKFAQHIEAQIEPKLSALQGKISKKLLDFKDTLDADIAARSDLKISDDKSINDRFVSLENKVHEFIALEIKTFKEDSERANQNLFLTLQSDITNLMDQTEDFSAKQTSGNTDGSSLPPNFIDFMTDTNGRLDSLEAQLQALDANVKKPCCQSASQIQLMIKKELEGSWTTNDSIWRNYFDNNPVLKAILAEKTETLARETKIELKKELMGFVREISQSEAYGVAETVMEDQLKSQITRQCNQTDFKVAGGFGKEQNDDIFGRGEINSLIQAALIQYDADKTGMFDYALETAGGSVISTRCTETFVTKTAMYTLFGIPIWYPSNNPRTAIQPGMMPGECWAFKGSTGYLVIQLSMPMRPTRFSLEHIPRTMSPRGEIDSAPRAFKVLGLRHEKDPEPVALGEYEYDANDTSRPLQIFDVQTQETENEESFSYIELDILSNHGNVNYTCLYRFRVHG